MQAMRAIGMGAQLTPTRKVMKNVVVKANIMVAIEMSNKIKPHMSFRGNDLRKSLSAYREVRIDKNVKIGRAHV